MSNEGTELVFTRRANLEEIANAIRSKTGDSGKYTPAEMARAIAGIKTGNSRDISVGDDGEWTRPPEWPDLDAIQIDYENDEQVVYLTMDNTSRSSGGTDMSWIGIRYNAGNANESVATLELGHLENDTFVVDRANAFGSIQDNGSSTWYINDNYSDSAYDYPVYRFTAPSNVTYFTFSGIDTTTTGMPYLVPSLTIRCLERVGNLPYLNAIESTSNQWSANNTYGCYSMQRDALVPGRRAAMSKLKNAWANCYALRTIDMTRWDTSRWRITTLEYAWYACWLLQSLDLSGWDTSGWKVTNLQSTWDGCRALRVLDLSGWNTTNWAVTNLQSAWENCTSLSELSVSGWDTSGWKVTTLISAWQDCYSLRKLDLSGWDTSNWAVTTIQNAWQNCTSLQSLDLSGWNTSNWAVTNMSGSWQNCTSLQSLDLSGWNTTGWKVTNASWAWQNCYSLQSLDLSGWNTSNWAVTTLGWAWANCYSLQSLDLSEWNTTGWKVTTIQNAWQNCYSLQSLDLSGWNTTGWKVTNANACWLSCYSIKTIDLSGWDASNWNVSSDSDICNNCRSLENFRVTSWITTKGDVFFKECYALTTESLHAIIASLPERSSNLRFTRFVFMRIAPDDLALAVAKGWTVSY